MRYGLKQSVQPSTHSALFVSDFRKKSEESPNFECNAGNSRVRIRVPDAECMEDEEDKSAIFSFSRHFSIRRESRVRVSSGHASIDRALLASDRAACYICEVELVTKHATNFGLFNETK